MAISQIKKCAKEALDLSHSIGLLNQDLFGVRVIFNKLDRFSESCKIDEQDKHIIKRLIQDGINYYENGKQEIARSVFEVASRNVLGDALINIRDKL